MKGKAKIIGDIVSPAFDWMSGRWSVDPAGHAHRPLAHSRIANSQPIIYRAAGRSPTARGNRRHRQYHFDRTARLIAHGRITIQVSLDAYMAELEARFTVLPITVAIAAATTRLPAI
jgi:hypothetical protein